MSSDQIVAAFRETVCAQVQKAPEGLDRYRVATPFEFDDGDRLVIVLKRVEGGWLLTDEAHTLMRLTYDLDEADLRRSTRQKLIANALAMGGVEGRDGELVLPIRDDRFGAALFSFVQAILRISDVSVLSRESVRSMFKDDLRALPERLDPAERRVFD